MSIRNGIAVRVSVPDVWDTVELEVDPTYSIAELKRMALGEATGVTKDADSYQVKYRGGLVLNERSTLAELGIPDGAALIVLPAKRIPVR